MYDEDACDLMTYGNFRTSLFAKKKVPFWPEVDAKVVGIVESSARSLNPRRDEDSTLSNVGPLPSLSF